MPRIGAYMKILGDTRKLKKLDIRISCNHNVRKTFLLFDNLIAKEGEGLGKGLQEPLLSMGFGDSVEKLITP